MENQHRQIKGYRELNEVEIAAMNEIKNLALITPPNPIEVIFEWAGNTDKYLIEISEDKNFANNIVKEFPVVNSYSWINPKPGKYSWRVKQIKGENVESTWSESQFTLITNPPTLTARTLGDTQFQNIEAFEKGSVSLLVKWNEVPFAESYQIDFSKNTQFSQFTTYKTSKTSLRIPVSEGSYFLRGRSLKKNELAVSDYSNPLPVIWKKELILVAPALAAPLNGVKIVSLNNSQTPVVFNWKRTSKNVIYQIQVSSAETFEDIIYSTDTTNNNAVFLSELKNTKLYWRVRAQYKRYNSPWSKISSFTIN